MRQAYQRYVALRTELKEEQARPGAGPELVLAAPRREASYRLPTTRTRPTSRSPSSASGTRSVRSASPATSACRTCSGHGSATSSSTSSSILASRAPATPWPWTRCAVRSGRRSGRNPLRRDPGHQAGLVPRRPLRRGRRAHRRPAERGRAALDGRRGGRHRRPPVPSRRAVAAIAADPVTAPCTGWQAAGRWARWSRPRSSRVPARRRWSTRIGPCRPGRRAPPTSARTRGTCPRRAVPPEPDAAARRARRTPWSRRPRAGTPPASTSSRRPLPVRRGRAVEHPVRPQRPRRPRPLAGRRRRLRPGGEPRRARAPRSSWPTPRPSWPVPGARRRAADGARRPGRQRGHRRHGPGRRARTGTAGGPEADHRRRLRGRVERPGYLWAYANDAWGSYGNNDGGVTLTVSRVRSAD